MVYLRKWRTTIPSGKGPGNILDDHIRDLRYEITERMGDFLSEGVGNWSADPIASVALKQQYAHWSAFTSEARSETRLFNTAYTVDGTSFGLKTTSGGHNYYVPILLPRGAVLKEVYLSCRTGPTGGIPWSIREINASTGVPTETTFASGTVPSNTSQSNVALTTTVNLTINNTPTSLRYYIFRVSFSPVDGVHIQGVRFSYEVMGVNHV